MGGAAVAHMLSAGWATGAGAPRPPPAACAPAPPRPAVGGADGRAVRKVGAFRGPLVAVGAVAQGAALVPQRFARMRLDQGRRGRGGEERKAEDAGRDDTLVQDRDLPDHARYARVVCWAR